MKKTVLLVIATLIFLLACSANAVAQEVKVFVQEEQVVFDVPPIEEKGRLLVPVRAIFEALGAEVTWDNSTQKVHAERDDFYVDITLNAEKAIINGQEEFLDVPARLINGRVLVPLRFSGNALGAVVNWDSMTSTVNINYRDPVKIIPSDIKPLSVDLGVTPGEYFPLSNGDFWIITYGENWSPVVSYFDSKSLALNEVASFEDADVSMDNVMATNDDKLVLILESDAESNNTIYVYDYKVDQQKEIKRIEFQCDGNIFISPNGEVVYNNDGPDNWGQIDLWRVDLEGKVIRLTNTPNISESDPIWSPDGSKIAFQEWRIDQENNPAVTVLNADGTNRQVVFDLPAPEWEGEFAWSPDSTTLACIRWSANDDSIWLVSSDGKTKKQVFSYDSTPQYPVWSPDGKKIAAVLTNELAVGAIDGSGEPVFFSGDSPVWSPDSSMLAYERYFQVWLCSPERNEASCILDGDIYQMLWIKQNELYMRSDSEVYKVELTEVN